PLGKWRSKFQAKYRFVDDKKWFQLCFVTTDPIQRRTHGRADRRAFCSFANGEAPVSRRKTRTSGVFCNSRCRSVADVYPAEAWYPSPAARSNPHDAAEAASPMPVAVAVIATAHSTTTLAATAGGSFGRNERRGTNGGDGGDSEDCLADHSSLLVLIGCVFTSVWSIGRMMRGVRRRIAS